MSTFDERRKIDVSEKIEQKNGLSYLSWAWAVDTLLQKDPTATWEYKDEKKFGDTLMVFCTVTAFGKSMTAQLPVMNYANKAVSNPDAFQVNTAMQRCLAKAIALHGIGLYIYAGEDVPRDPESETKPKDEYLNTGVRPAAGVLKMSPEEQQERIGEGNIIKGTPMGKMIFTKKSEVEKFEKSINEGKSFITHDEQLSLHRLLKEKEVAPEGFKAWLKEDLKVPGTNKIRKEDYNRCYEWIIKNAKQS